jgi:hypothetical protein
MHDEKHKNFLCSDQHTKSLRGKLSPYTRIKDFFHTCLKTRKHGIQDQIPGTTAFDDDPRRLINPLLFDFVAYRMCILCVSSSLFAQRWNQNLLSKVLCE